MKKLIVSLCCLLLFLSNYTLPCPAQTSNNTIVNDNSSWNVIRRAIDGVTITHTDHYYFDGDLTIGEHSYKKMFFCNDTLREKSICRGLMREEGGKIYFIWEGSDSEDSQTETLLYDFSLEEGMSFEHKNPWNINIMFYVNRVDSVEINGSQKKRIQLTRNSDFKGVDDIWIESVGSLVGILYPSFYIWVGGYHDLLCHYKGGELIYKNPEYSDCYYDPIQTSNNTIVNENSSWSVLDRNPVTGTFIGTVYYYFDGDTIIGEHSYKKMVSCSDRLHEKCGSRILLREQDKKTYLRIISNELDTEFLLYDFSLEDGMTFVYKDIRGYEMPFYARVDFVEINGKLKKRIQLTDGPDSTGEFDTWIEGIGSLGGILYPANYFLSGKLYYLLCYYENNELIYKHPDFTECYYDATISIREIATNGCTVYPNPTDGLLWISGLNNSVSRIDIYDISGKKVYSQVYEEFVDLSSFENGIYLLKVYDTEELISVFKIIKRP